MLIQIEEGFSMKICPKLTLSHIYPDNWQKMNVKLSTQVIGLLMINDKTLIKFSLTYFPIAFGLDLNTTGRNVMCPNLPKPNRLVK
jgi:hypothetical protein